MPSVADDLTATMLWDSPPPQEQSPRYFIPTLAPDFVPLCSGRNVPVYCDIWTNKAESGDVLTMKAKQFVALVEDGMKPAQAAKQVGATIETLQKTRPEIERTIVDFINLYQMPKEVRRAHVRAVQTKIMLDNMDGGLEQQELALKASKLIGEDEEVQVYRKGVTAPAPDTAAVPQLPEGFAKLIEAAELPKEEKENETD